MTQKTKQIALRIGNKTVQVTPLPDDEVAKVNRRIQENIDMLYDPRKQRKIRHAASITASRIILNV